VPPWQPGLGRSPAGAKARPGGCSSTNRGLNEPGGSLFLLFCFLFSSCFAPSGAGARPWAGASPSSMCACFRCAQGMGRHNGTTTGPGRRHSRRGGKGRLPSFDAPPTDAHHSRGVAEDPEGRAHPFERRRSEVVGSPEGGRVPEKAALRRYREARPPATNLGRGPGDLIPPRPSSSSPAVGRVLSLVYISLSFFCFFLIREGQYLARWQRLRGPRGPRP